METSIFMDKAVTPDDFMLRSAVSDLYPLWAEFRSYVFEKYPDAMAEWNYPGQKYGWNFRIKDKKRTIIYMLPRDQYFLVAFVFGEKATTDALESDISPGIKSIIESARVYAEGRGFRIELKNKEYEMDIKKLIDLKLKY